MAVHHNHLSSFSRFAPNLLCQIKSLDHEERKSVLCLGGIKFLSCRKVLSFVFFTILSRLNMVGFKKSSLMGVVPFPHFYQKTDNTPTQKSIYTTFFFLLFVLKETLQNMLIYVRRTEMDTRRWRKRLTAIIFSASVSCESLIFSFLISDAFFGRLDISS